MVEVGSVRNGLRKLRWWCRDASLTCAGKRSMDKGKACGPDGISQMMVDVVLRWNATDIEKLIRNQGTRKISSI